MRLMAVAVVAAFAVGALSTTHAEPRKRQGADAQPGPGATTIVSRDEQGRTRTKILVQKRSYLDGGTEVMPGDIQGQQSNFIQMYQNPTSSVSNNTIVPNHPIPDPFFLPGKNNPYFRW